MCTMYPGRRLGPCRGGEQQQQPSGSSSSRPTGGDGNRGSENTTRRSRTTSRDRRNEAEEAITALHRRVALMFVTVVEGRYVARRPVTEQGIRSALVAASRTLDAGSYLTLQQALNFLDTPNEERARRLLNDLLYTVERTDGRLPHEPAELSRLLLQRYSEVIRMAGYPLARIQEMVYGPTLGPETPSRDSEYSSYTIAEPFNENASRSRDDATEHSGVEGERDYRDSRGRGESRRHRESSSTEEWTRREALHAEEGEGNGLRGAGGEKSQRGEGGEEETMVESTPEGESVLERGDGRFNAFEPEGEPSELGGERAVPGQAVPGRAVRSPLTYPDLTPEEVSGEQYPGYDVDLTPFSQYERMCRLCQCLERRIEIAVANNDYETYERWARELSRVEELQAVASDLRPGEEGSEGAAEVSSRAGG